MPPERVVSPNLRHGAREIRFMQRSESDRTGTEVGATQTIPRSMLSSEDNSFDSWEVYSRSSFPSSCQASPTVTDEVLSNSGLSPFRRGNDNEVVSEVLPSILESDDDVLHYHEQVHAALCIRPVPCAGTSPFSSRLPSVGIFFISTSFTNAIHRCHCFIVQNYQCTSFYLI